MSTRVTRVTRTVVTRPLTDIDPKIVAVGIIAAVATLVAVVVVIALTVAGKPIDWAAVSGPVGTGAAALLVGYLRSSSHTELVEDLEQGTHFAGELVHELEPAVAAALPTVAPEAKAVEDGVDAIAGLFADPATSDAPATAPAE